MKRFIDISLGLLILVLITVPLIFISIFVKATSSGPIIYWSERVGKGGDIFYMPKFRTMKINTPQVATHLLQNPENHLTIFGKFLRKFSLDELPQIYSVLKGQMTFVGPRPALYNQYDLIGLRQKCGLEAIKPGITGWAQVNGRDELSIQKKVEFEIEYRDRQSVLFDIYILWLTFMKVFRRKTFRISNFYELEK